jgi:hypothetical protein
MADDWRLTVDFDDEADGAQLTERLHAREFASDERRRFGERVIVSRAAARVFFYMGSEEQAREVESVVRAELAERENAVILTLERWHPVEQVWQDAGVPLPQTEAEFAAEYEHREAREEAESFAAGKAEWEIRIELANREQTDALADRLQGEGIPVVRRSTFLLVGAASEADAAELAERLRAEAPEGAEVHVQPGGEMVWEVAPKNPFAFLGGLGG